MAFFEDVRHDPRFKKLLERLGHPDHRRVD
jgi:hypothetical protein